MIKEKAIINIYADTVIKKKLTDIVETLSEKEERKVSLSEYVLKIIRQHLKTLDTKDKTQGFKNEDGSKKKLKIKIKKSK